MGSLGTAFGLVEAGNGGFVMSGGEAFLDGHELDGVDFFVKLYLELVGLLFLGL